MMKDLVADTMSWAHSLLSVGDGPCLLGRLCDQPTLKCISASGCLCTTRENAGCELQARIRMVMAHLSQSPPHS